MSFLEIIAVILVLYVIGYPIIWLLGLIKEIGDEVAGEIKKKQNKKEVPISPSSQSLIVSSRTDDDILNSAEFQQKLEYLRPHYRWMTLAGGNDPWLHPLICFEQDGSIVLKKQGYDLYDRDIKAYYSESHWEEREKALERFGRELFGEYAEEMKQIVSFEYIADRLIELEQSTCSSSHFCLIVSTHGNFKSIREKELFRRELQNTPILMK